MAEPAFNADRNAGSNQDDGPVMGVPDAWLVMLHPLHCICRSEDFPALEEDCAILSTARPGQVFETGLLVQLVS